MNLSPPASTLKMEAINFSEMLVEKKKKRSVVMVASHLKILIPVG
jgi:hypothetical protein